MFLLGKDWDFSSSGVFSGLKIDPDTLVKKLDLDSRSIISSRTGFLLQYLPLEAKACSSVALANQLPGNVWVFLERMMNQLWNGMNN
ncbi:hypothetical protein AAES_01463 [Amazona aestiva]|uniref:Uncharacterized protein n=1 Tax=Amazona aestiva TaxID=12930 RepID=A0A0Q3XC80_AMAAE|nr:hypothetical protein AAES_01463 [Amazona aestiva]